MTGTVHLVGAGPGDPGLATVRAVELLRTCDALVHDALVAPELLDPSWLGRGDAPDLHNVGKRGGEASANQEDINALLIRLAREGKRVVRLKGGDPFVFGRGSEEAQALAEAGVSFEIVPGITAGIAAAAYAGIPVTHRGRSTSVTLVTGHEDPAKERSDTDWQALARAGGTLVLYMGMRRLPDIVEALLAGGRLPGTPAAVVQWGTTTRQRTATGTLGTIVRVAGEAGIGAPAVTIIGSVAELREEIAWFDRRPLFGRRVLVTRARPQASELSRLLRAAGADVLEIPTIRVEPLDPAPLRASLSRLGSYDWVLLTSRNAVDVVWDALLELGLDARAFASVGIAAVGSATADALARRGLRPDVVPERATSEALADALLARDDVKGSRTLLPRALETRDVLGAALERGGCTVDEVAVYRTVPDAAAGELLRESLRAQPVDMVTFTSGSTVTHFVEAVGAEVARGVRGVSIGPITSAAMRDAGIDVAAEAPSATIASLAESVVRLLSRDQLSATP